MVTLPDNLRGRSLHANVIPTVCNVRNMFSKLVSVNGDYGQLKNWEKRSYTAYQIDKIKPQILSKLNIDMLQPLSWTLF